MNTVPTLLFQEIIRLPYKIIERENSAGKMLIIETPHKGAVTIDFQETHYPFLFGSVKTIDKTTTQLFRELRKLEEQAVEFWFNEFKRK